MAVWLSLSLSQGTPNTTARTTTVTATLTIHYSGGSYDGTNPTGSIVIDGKSYSFTKNFNYAGYQQGAATQGTGSTSVSVTATVEYGTSSSRTVYVDASFSRASSSVSGSIALTAISSGGSSGGGTDDDDNGEEWEGNDPPSSGTTDPLPGNATILGQATLSAAASNPEYELWMTGYVNFSLTAGNSRICIVKFVTPEFVGTSTSLDVELNEPSVSGLNDGYVAYALCSSDKNNGNYIGATTTNVYDPTRIAQGQLSRAEWNAGTFSIQTNKLESESEYYLIFWSPGEAPYTDTKPTFSLGDAAEHGFTVNSAILTRGLVYVDNGASFDAYEVFIDNGTSFDKYECYIDNGSGWDLVGGTL